MKSMKPKFKLRDTVFFLFNNSVYEMSVLRIEIRESVKNEFDGHNRSVIYHLGSLSGVTAFKDPELIAPYKKKESEIFKTKAELLKSL